MSTGRGAAAAHLLHHFTDGPNRVCGVYLEPAAPQDVRLVHPWRHNPHQDPIRPSVHTVSSVLHTETLTRCLLPPLPLPTPPQGVKIRQAVWVFILCPLFFTKQNELFLKSGSSLLRTVKKKDLNTFCSVYVFLLSRPCVYVFVCVINVFVQICKNEYLPF